MQNPPPPRDVGDKFYNAFLPNTIILYHTVFPRRHLGGVIIFAILYFLKGILKRNSMANLSYKKGHENNFIN